MQFDQRSALGRGSSHPIWRYATAALMAFISGALFAGSAAADAYVQRSEVQSYIDELVTNHGFSRIALEEVFSESTKQERIIELMSRPAERRLAWHEYQKILVDEPRVSQGVVFWRENKQALERAAKAQAGDAVRGLPRRGEGHRRRLGRGGWSWAGAGLLHSGEEPGCWRCWSRSLPSG